MRETCPPMGQPISADWITVSKHHHRAEATALGPHSADPGHAIFHGRGSTTASKGGMLQPSCFGGYLNPLAEWRIGTKEPLSRASHGTLWSAKQLFEKMRCGNTLRLWRPIFPTIEQGLGRRVCNQKGSEFHWMTIKRGRFR